MAVTRGRGGGHSKTGKRQIARADDISKALDMRRQGSSYREIAAALDCSVGQVHKIVANYVEQHPAPNLEAYRHEARERHEAIIAAHWKKRGNTYSAKAIQDSEKILMAIMGAEAPKKAEITLVNDSNEQLLDRINRLAVALGQGEGDSESEAGGGDGDPVSVAPLGEAGAGSSDVRVG